MKTRVSLCLTGSLAFILWLSGCGRKPEPHPAAELQPVNVRARIIESKSRVATEEVVGTVRARWRAVIEAKISGRIERLPVVPGQRVEAGELLVGLDAREVQARLDQVLAVRQQAETDLQRAGSLLAQKILSQAEYDHAQAGFRVADAAVREATTLLDHARVTAPFAGVITRKFVETGDFAAPDKPLLELEDPRDLRLEADVPEAVVGRLTIGDRLSVRVSSMSNDLAAVVGEISPAADPNSRTFLVKLDLPAAPGLRAGQFGRAAVPVGETSALRVPASALVQRGQLELVFIAADGHARLRIVKSGKRISDEIELVSGVEAGERVIVENAAGLVDGQPVTLKP